LLKTGTGTGAAPSTAGPTHARSRLSLPPPSRVKTFVGVCVCVGVQPARHPPLSRVKSSRCRSWLVFFSLVGSNSLGSPQINLKQAQHAAFALRVLLQGGGREAVRRCEAVDGLDHLLQLSRTSRKKQAVENAVIAIGILTQSSRAVELSTGFESSRHGLT